MAFILSTLFPELAASSKKGAHFVGAGGIGMSALARWFMAQNRVRKVGPKRPISGSDLAKSPITLALSKEGLEVKMGHKKGHISRRVGLVIYSKAAKSTNPELVAARTLKIPAISYAEAVGRLTQRYKTIAIAGAHGKSTTTAIVSLVLEKGGFDPTVIVGTNLKEFGGRNFRPGRKGLLVLEADEFGKSFLHYSPTVAVVTNIDLEHLDTYRNLSDVKNTFFKFLSNTNRGGILILNKDSKNLWALAPRIKKLAREKNYRVLWYSVCGNTAKKIRKIIKISGEHNVSNAVAAYKVGRTLGIAHSKILSTIGAYRGAWRRMEYRGEWKMENGKWKIKVFDDYAHHPAEIRATLRGFREKYPDSPIACVYQPHQMLRLKKLWKDFIKAFADADVLVLIPAYKVAGRDKIDPRFTSKTLSAAIKRKYPNRAVFYLPNPKDVKKFLFKQLNDLRFARLADSPRFAGEAGAPAKRALRHSPIIVMMGAGDIIRYTNLLLRR